MLEVLSNGTEYLITQIGKSNPGWCTIGSAETIEDAKITSKRDWDHYWSLTGITPSRPIKISVDLRV